MDRKHICAHIIFVRPIIPHSTSGTKIDVKKATIFNSSLLPNYKPYEPQVGYKSGTIARSGIKQLTRFYSPIHRRTTKKKRSEEKKMGLFKGKT